MSSEEVIIGTNKDHVENHSGSGKKETPPYRRYAILALTFLAIVGLVVGLSVGLSKKNSRSNSQSPITVLDDKSSSSMPTTPISEATPVQVPTAWPKLTSNPTTSPTITPSSKLTTTSPTKTPTSEPTRKPTLDPTQNPNMTQQTSPTKSPVEPPTESPTAENGCETDIQLCVGDNYFVTRDPNNNCEFFECPPLMGAAMDEPIPRCLPNGWQDLPTSECLEYPDDFFCFDDSMCEDPEKPFCGYCKAPGCETEGVDKNCNGRCISDYCCTDNITNAAQSTWCF